MERNDDEYIRRCVSRIRHIGFVGEAMIPQGLVCQFPDCIWPGRGVGVYVFTPRRGSLLCQSAVLLPVQYARHSRAVRYISTFARLSFMLNLLLVAGSGRHLRYYAFAAASLLHHLHIFAGVLLRSSGQHRGACAACSRFWAFCFYFLACWVPHLSGSRTNTIT